MNHVLRSVTSRCWPLFSACMMFVLVAGCTGKQGRSGAAVHKPATAPALAHETTYSTSFNLAESPLSEGGRWMGGKTVGLDWGDVSTTPGYAVGQAGDKEYADSVALLTGKWGPDQAVEAVVDRRNITRYPEVSLRLRSTLGPHDCKGYEVSYSLRDENDIPGQRPYLIIVKWNGPVADFKYLVQVGGPQYAAKNGDVIKATIVGNVITTYKNGVQMGQVKDDTFVSGNPGFGFNENKNGDYGISRFSASATEPNH